MTRGFFATLGLSVDAESVYRVILREPGLQVEALTARMQLPPEHVHDALGELTRLGLLQPSRERPRHLHLVDPEISLTSLLASHEAELLQRQQAIATGRAEVSDLIAEYNQRNGSPGRAGIKYLSGLDDVRTYIEVMGRECVSDVMAFVDGGPQTKENMEASRSQDQSVLARGVWMRSIYLESLANDPATLAYVRWLTEEGASIRTIPMVPLRMIIFDRRVALLPVQVDDTSMGAMVLPYSSVITALCALFEKLWEEATPLGVAPRREHDGLSGQELSLLKLMAEGNTDEVCARKLGISLRTERRLAADLMARLNAKSRFQAGVLAAQAGWLTDDAAVAQLP
ncbi:helix-turn-helix transcriptional regulator [Nonomuraea sp. K274]|uniref:Helix-turn-helix transcriptional regulator n=1 Tax=Nonomuraea cypriaca TaxID=1187855 RepID=A0A931A4S7_9ACTN|nr:helix-turn-helix transcriptional regulator [Nonomuraea cypriaca]MBF8184779.1 helix-turn-helix transcriptional regulator [Nonomuraea cypriaca]